VERQQSVNVIEDKRLQAHLVRLHPDVENERKRSFSEGGGVD
jgi:hypothetical protein